MTEELQEGQSGVGEELEGEATPEPTAEPDSPEEAPQRQPKVDLDELPEFRKFRSAADRRVAERDRRIKELETAVERYQGTLAALPDYVEDAGEELPQALLSASEYAELQERRRRDAEHAEERRAREYWMSEIERLELDPGDPDLARGLVSLNREEMLDALYQARKRREMSDAQAAEEAKRTQKRRQVEEKAQAGDYDAMPTGGGTPQPTRTRQVRDYEEEKQKLVRRGATLEEKIRLRREHQEALDELAKQEAAERAERDRRRRQP